MRPHPARSSHQSGRHELGQNFLHHRPALATLRRLVGETSGSILEIGPGDGALTRELVRLGRDIRAVEIDPRRAQRLAARLPQVTVEHADALAIHYDRPVVVGNLPFHLTTPLLRALLRGPDWHHAVLVVQWEVARKRAGVGGGTMMTAQAAPWYAFALHGRVPARGFRPMPSVDGGILTIDRRAVPLVPARRRSAYAAFVRSVFTGPGAGLRGILNRLVDRPTLTRALDAAGVAASEAARSTPRDLTAEQWAALWRVIDGRGTPMRTPRHRRR